MFNPLWKSFIEKQNEYLFGQTFQSLVDKRNELDLEIINLQTQLKEKSKIESPKETGKITNNQVRKILKDFNIPNLQLADDSYSTCSYEDAVLFQKKITNLLNKYSGDHDCDNFSFESIAYWRKDLSFSYFVVWSSGHAFNLFIDEKFNAWIVEPQTGLFYSKDSASKFTSPDGMRYFPFRTLIG